MNGEGEWKRQGRKKEWNGRKERKGKEREEQWNLGGSVIGFRWTDAVEQQNSQC